MSGRAEERTPLDERQKLQLQGRDRITWESNDIRTRAFNDAQTYFSANPKDEKLSRKKSNLPVSFVKIKGEIVALNAIASSEFGRTSARNNSIFANKQNKKSLNFYRLGGTFSRYKCAERQNGEQIGVLISKKEGGSKSYGIVKNLGVDAYSGIFDEQRGARLGPKDYLVFFIAALEAAEKFHKAKKGIHGDIKPENFMVRCTELSGEMRLTQVILIDEPKSTPLFKSPFNTYYSASTGFWTCTAYYKAPEINRYNREAIISEKQDVYSLGRMGQHLFGEHYNNLSTYTPAQNMQMRTLADKMVSVDINARPSIADCISDLKKLYQDQNETGYDERGIVADHLSGGSFGSVARATGPGGVDPRGASGADRREASPLGEERLVDG